ncbi:hypothetical protein DO97_19435 [Neosynechococcus sphagnicola sy1]|uniref:Diguanylate cyclase n=1 Tax=Neosynechococcus sphagnicola sy1 TaxID=1497020 RepID=A0A098THL6_9CYAN|nr:response regulator [Neosynechococcus sphagnicola]KGF71477.1 hypothetical protein DO97_19435 [Neosynechococcus sphagnicola sy1]
MTLNTSKPARILVIDDSLTVRAVISDYLEDAGYVIETADTGEEAWAMICNNPPDLIISDWSMPGLSGIGLCRRIRADPALEHIYFLLLTAREEISDLILGLDTGADEFITKPINREELRARIRAGLRLRQLTQSLMEVNQQLHARNELLASLALIDPVTGVLNRRALETGLPGLLLQVGDHQAEVFHNSQYFLYYRYLSIWLIQLDQFDEQMVAYGTEVATQLVQIVARRLQSNCLPGSLLYYYGDATFACITPGLDSKRTSEFGEVLRQAIAANPIKLPSGAQVLVTVSLGGNIASPDGTLDQDILLKQAEQCLIQARIAGHNRTRLFEGKHP